MTQPVVTTAARAIRASMVRTWTPMIVAGVTHLLLGAKIDIGDNELLTNAVAFLVDSAIAMAFYAIVRILELAKSSQWGRWLLGLGIIKTAPVYVRPGEAATAMQGPPD